MRISDWSSDVCSSDLRSIHEQTTIEKKGHKFADEVRITEREGDESREKSRPPSITIRPTRSVRGRDARRRRVRDRERVARGSEERRVGNEGVSPVGSRGWPYHSKTTKTNKPDK